VIPLLYQVSLSSSPLAGKFTDLPFQVNRLIHQREKKPHEHKTPADIEFYQRERTLHIHAGKSAGVSSSTSNHIVAVEVNHAHMSCLISLPSTAPLKSFDILALYKFDYYYYY